MKNANVFNQDVRIHGGKIVEIGDTLVPGKNERVLRLSNHYLYCGLTNSHDHLEMNLYPRMGSPPYHNYIEWARDIYKPAESPVAEIERIPVEYRLLYGGFKNLVSGVTTVIHHNPWHRSLAHRFPVRVLRRYAWAHSLAFERRIQAKFPLRNSTPFIVHAAEGIDSLARNEIKELNSIGLLKPNSVLIHGVALENGEIELVSLAGSSLVWCPSSNYFMFGQTASVSQIKRKILVALGTDSLMTGRCTLFEEMRVAKESKEAAAREIFDMVTVTPQRIFKLPEQQILPGFPADLLILPIKSEDYYENLAQQKSEDVIGVIIDGQLQFADESLAADVSAKGYVRKIGSAKKWFGHNIDKLKLNILSTGISEEILQRNDFWKLLN